MRVDAFDFDLPAELIAQEPARPRDSSRLLHVGETFRPHAFLDLPGLLRPGDLMIVNDTRVIPVRFGARRGETPIEVTLTEQADAGRWLAFIKPGRKVRDGDRLVLGEDIEAVAEGRTDDGRFRLAFALQGDALLDAIKREGAMPLPPYIKRPAVRAEDAKDYQTAFAEADGAIAAPTAGLHFTPRVLSALEERGVAIAPLTLHVGIGTFLPMRAEDTDDHVMHEERYVMPEATARAIALAKDEGRRVVACGTTALRVLETLADDTGHVEPGAGATRLFVTPGFRFRCADVLLTNFHLPRSTLFMLVSAFAGLERMKAAYAFAVKERFRFFSYGDACLIERAAP